MIEPKMLIAISSFTIVRILYGRLVFVDRTLVLHPADEAQAVTVRGGDTPRFVQ
jgi:hypothetical protein